MVATREGDGCRIAGRGGSAASDGVGASGGVGRSDCSDGFWLKLWLLAEWVADGRARGTPMREAVENG